MKRAEIIEALKGGAVIKVRTWTDTWAHGSSLSFSAKIEHLLVCPDKRRVRIRRDQIEALAKQGVVTLRDRTGTVVTELPTPCLTKDARVVLGYLSLGGEP